MDITQILNSKKKPDLSNYKEKDLIDLLAQKDINVDKSLSSNQLIDMINNLWNTHTYNDSDCPICLEQVTNLNHLVTSCGHYFHTTCYTKYLVGVVKNNLEPKCPQCRSNLLPKECDINQNTEENNNIYNYLTHQELFFPQAGLFGRNIFFENNDNDNDNIFDNFSFPINLHSGLWTDVNEMSGILVQNIVGNQYQSDSGFNSIDVNHNINSSLDSNSESDNFSN